MSLRAVVADAAFIAAFGLQMLAWNKSGMSLKAAAGTVVTAERTGLGNTEATGSVTIVTTELVATGATGTGNTEATRLDRKPIRFFREAARLVREVTRLVRETTRRVRRVTRLVRDVTRLVREATRLVREATRLIRFETRLRTLELRFALLRLVLRILSQFSNSDAAKAAAYGTCDMLKTVQFSTYPSLH